MIRLQFFESSAIDIMVIANISGLWLTFEMTHITYNIVDNFSIWLKLDARIAKCIIFIGKNIYSREGDSNISFLLI